MSIAGSPCKAIYRGKKTGCMAIQIFTRNRLKWHGKDLTTEETDDFIKARDETNIIPAAIHASYLINLASPLKKKREKSLTLLLREIEWAKQLNIPHLVLHPGFHMGTGEEMGLIRITEMLNKALELSGGYKVNILLETTSGQGTGIGYRFEHLAGIMEGTKATKRVGVCFDTCHAFAAGYDFRQKEEYGQIIGEFDKIIGIERLKLFHLNDSKTGIGSRLDRHEHPGKGCIGLEPFSFFLNDPRFKDHAFLLETPKGLDENGRDMDMVNLELLENIIEREI